MTYTAIPAQSIPWVTVISDTQMIVNQGYIINGGVALNMTLPVNFAEGDLIRIRGADGNGWIVKQNAGQSCQVNNLTTTVGTLGEIQSDQDWNSIDLLGYIADTKMSAFPIGGEPNVV
jgi:hypothetical protein